MPFCGPFLRAVGRSWTVRSAGNARVGHCRHLRRKDLSALAPTLGSGSKRSKCGEVIEGNHGGGAWCSRSMEELETSRVGTFDSRPAPDEFTLFFGNTPAQQQNLEKLRSVAVQLPIRQSAQEHKMAVSKRDECIYGSRRPTLKSVSTQSTGNAFPPVILRATNARRFADCSSRNGRCVSLSLRNVAAPST